jgi:ribulose-5-phosphate 4-epimerase/fuculose-1-phosphate aldolase
MLRNHGLLTVGATVADAFLAMYLFETVCAIQVRAQAGGGELVHVDPHIIAGARQQSVQVTRGLGAQLTWPGLLRRLDRRLPGYDA